MIDERAPAPWGTPAAQAPAYGPAYGGAEIYPAGAYARSPANVVTPTTGAMLEADLVEARNANSRGTLLYIVGWILIAVSVPVLAIAIGLIASASGTIAGTAQDAFVAALGLLSAGIAVRGIGFAQLMKGDFLLRGHAWLGQKK